jgi:signal transduction histidine kinase
VRIAPGQRNLEIQYVGLSWSRPARIRFRYRLTGVDHDWVEAGTRRTAYYTHLPPGEYGFTVIADNGDGVWNTEGKSLRVVVMPPFYRTWWFITLAIAGAAGVLAFAWHVRVSQLQRAQAAHHVFARQLIASQEQERKRIAAELHDSLGQQFLLIKNSAARQQFGDIDAAATQGLEEVRSIAYDLRPLNLDRLGLTVALEEMIDKVSSASGLTCAAGITPIDGCLTTEGEINLYRIIQEGVNNIVRHARATRASVEAWPEDGYLHVIVRDDGCGFDAAATAGRSAAPPGLGLMGIAERVRLLGGTHTMTSASGQGTTLTIRIPL